jgi:hypothetical protein
MPKVLGFMAESGQRNGKPAGSKTAQSLQDVIRLTGGPGRMAGLFWLFIEEINMLRMHTAVAALMIAAASVMAAEKSGTLYNKD